MKRGTFDVLRRGFDNTLANWPLIAIRVGETVVFLVCAFIAAIAIFAPILVSIGISIADLTSPDDIQNVLVAFARRWMLLLWIVLTIAVLLTVFVAVHAFVEAGSARVYVDGERIAGAEVMGFRSRFKVFSLARWLAGGRDGWWTLFWIYNIGWTIASAILLVPLLPTAVVMFATHDAQPQVALASGCLGLFVTLLLMLVVAVVTTICINRAIAHWAVRGSGAREALAAGWAAMRGDLGRLFLIAIALFVVSLAGSSFFGGLSFFAVFGTAFIDAPVGVLVTFPIRILSTICSSIFSAAVSSWFLAAYASVEVEE
ncbi:MAG TPA: hypothetical protein VF911_06960 [Thermoanaerobaculia bacterium]